MQCFFGINATRPALALRIQITRATATVWADLASARWLRQRRMATMDVDLFILAQEKKQNPHAWRQTCYMEWN
jgi:hypothetical protein